MLISFFLYYFRYEEDNFVRLTLSKKERVGVPRFLEITNSRLKDNFT